MYLILKLFCDNLFPKTFNNTSRCLNAITTWVKLYLQSEQKKSDFKPETDDFDTVASPVRLLHYCNISEILQLLHFYIPGV